MPTIVEPKVFFANERTFLAWMHMSITLSSISVAILAFADANEWSQVYGLMLMPVAIAFCCYSLWMYMKRATMIRARHPGPCKLSPLPLLAFWLMPLLFTSFFSFVFEYPTISSHFFFSSLFCSFFIFRRGQGWTCRSGCFTWIHHLGQFCHQCSWQNQWSLTVVSEICVELTSTMNKRK